MGLNCGALPRDWRALGVGVRSAALPSICPLCAHAQWHECKAREIAEVAKEREEFEFRKSCTFRPAINTKATSALHLFWLLRRGMQRGVAGQGKEAGGGEGRGGTGGGCAASRRGKGHHRERGSASSVLSRAAWTVRAGPHKAADIAPFASSWCVQCCYGRGTTLSGDAACPISAPGARMHLHAAY